MQQIARTRGRTRAIVLQTVAATLVAQHEIERICMRNLLVCAEERIFYKIPARTLTSRAHPLIARRNKP